MRKLSLINRFSSRYITKVNSNYYAVNKLSSTYINTYKFNKSYLSTSSILQNKVSNTDPTSKEKEKEGKLAIQFTCKVCNNRQINTMSKLAYTKGVVLIQCLKCENRHLIADNLGWFEDKKVNIETILKEKGEQVKKLNSNELEGLIDVLDKEKE